MEKGNMFAKTTEEQTDRRVAYEALIALSLKGTVL
jgi:hypothetical protein